MRSAVTEKGRVVVALMLVVGMSLGGPGSLAARQDDGGAESSRRSAAVRSPTQAVPRTGDIVVDGVLDDAAWSAASPVSGFIQRDPVEGAPAEEDTEVRILIDREAIWVGLRMFDSNPAGIARQLFRRDGRGQADRIEVGFDPNLDRRTGYVFGVTAANVQNDKYLYDDEREDDAWDAVWSSAVSVDDEGWSAEMRIPLSQIRYEASSDVQTWGFNVSRERLANNEHTLLTLISKLRQGLVSQFGHLQGVRVPSSSRRIELRPYAVSQFHRGPAEAGDPFFDGTAATNRVGVDLRYGLGAAFTLDATINPDFGQVEADPAVINLSAFESFFQERRPFFVEDARVFDFGLSGGRNSLFYSRRIGRSPHGGAPDGAVFQDIPDNATILGAAKLAGRTSSGLSIGALAAVTGNETGQALVDGSSEIQEFRVEPRTEYGVVSLQQDFRGGASNIGGIVTALRRDLPEDGAFDFLPSTAFNGGVRFEHQWSDREWALWGFLSGSQVRGSTEAITRIQESSNHYFQRPDATRFSPDPEATSMGGVEWRLQFERRSGKHWTGSVWAAEVTRGFEINDLGFSGSAERLDGGVRFGYREINPGPVFRNYNLDISTFHNISHEALDDGWSLESWRGAYLRGTVSLNARGELLNYWSGNLGLSYTPDGWSRTATRGGPIMKDPGGPRLEARFNGDRRKAVSVGGRVELRTENEGGGKELNVNADVRIRPSPSLELSVQPQYQFERVSDQYVAVAGGMAFEPTYGPRYLFADLERRTFSMETRLNWTFSPQLSLQLFAQPLLSSGDFVTYKQLERAGSFDFRALQPGTGAVAAGGVRCSGGDICRVGDEQYVDFDRDGAADFDFGERDFNVRSLIGNAVLRWEYRPGSTIFFVWQRRQADRALLGDFDFGRDAGALFDAPADDRFIVKVNYWLGM
jgi:hypothetical protein